MALPVPAIVDAAARCGSAGVEIGAVSAADVETCRHWGFPVAERDGRLFLADDEDLLVAAWIERDTSAFGGAPLRAAAFLEIDSTNAEALRRARDGDTGPLVIAAETQTSGRGRKGRRWHSAAGQGLYMTLLVEPQLPAARWPLLGLATATAVARTLEQWVPVELKWPNDVLVSGKKSAGILLETALGPSARQVVAIGIGINVGAQAVPRELADRATSLALEHGRTVPRRRLLSRLLSQLEREWLGFARGADAAILSGWMRYSRMHEGTEVSIEDGGGRRTATTAGLTELGALRVRIDGREEIVLSADVTVRLGV